MAQLDNMEVAFVAAVSWLKTLDSNGCGVIHCETVKGATRVFSGHLSYPLTSSGVDNHGELWLLCGGIFVGDNWLSGTKY